jgi:RNA polymerase sigma factor (sigma-70 family)
MGQGTCPQGNQGKIFCRVLNFLLVIIVERELERRRVKVWNDEQLILSFRAGNPSAFETIIKHYQGYVFAIILSFVNGNEASDIAQEVFLQLYRSLPGYKSDNLKAWIGKITVHKAIDWKRSHQTRFDMEPNNIDIMALQDNMAQAPDEFVISQENRQRIRALCHNLPSRYGRVIIKYYYENKSYQQIAREEGVNLRTVESRLYRARNLIRQKWKEEQG